LRRPKTRFHQHGKTDHFQKSCSLRGSATLRDYVAISLGQVSHLFHHSLPVKKILSIEITAPNRAVFACKDGCRDRAFPFVSQEVIAGAGVIIREVPPFPIRHKNGEITIAEGRQGLIVNVFTEPDWRRRGLAQLLMEQIIAWSREQRLDGLVLHASDDGRVLYEKLGFVPTTEMSFGGGDD